MLAYFLTVAGGALTLCIFLYFRVKKEYYKAIFFKAITSFLFIACALCAVCINSTLAFSTLPALIILGLLCGLFGDLWLDLKNMHPQGKDIYQFIGMGSFLASHLFFAPAFFLISEKQYKQVLCGIGIGLLFAIAVMLLEKPMKNNYGKFKLITFFYSLTIGASSGISVIVFFKSGFALAQMFLMIGMICVLISDVILSGTYFSTGKDRPVDIISNHALYYIGQFFVASSLMFA